MKQPRNISPPDAAGSPVPGRPLSARSVLASTLLGIDPPRLPTILLVRSGELFGFPSGTTRTAISRMLANGELEADGDGYRLAGRLLERQERQRTSRATDATHPWDGAWELAVVVGERRSAPERTALREAMRRLKMAEWREGVWTRPANLPATRVPAARAVVEAQCRWVDGVPRDDPSGLVASLWDLPSWCAEATELGARLASLAPRVESGDTTVLAEGFVVSAAVLRLFLADPELPAALLPEGWPGRALRDDYERYDRAYKDLWRSWFGTQLPAP